MGLSFKKQKIEFFFEYFLATYCVYANGSWAIFEFGTLIKILGYTFFSCYLLYDIYKNKTIAFPNLIILFLALSPLLSKLINIEVDSSFVNTVSTVVIYLLLGLYRKELLFSILNKVAEVIFVLCIISIVFAILFDINYAWLNFFSLHFNNFADVNGYHNLIVYTARANNDYRIQGIFWEPGAWVYNEIFAFYWFLFVKKKSNVLLIFLFSILLTTSTTGFILVVILACQIWFFSKDRALKKKLIYIIGAITIVIVAISSYVAAKLDFNILDILYQQTIDKLFNKDSQTAMVSATERMSTTAKAFSIAKDNPIFGIGRQTPEKAIFVTSSISEISYQLGFLYLIIFMYVYRAAFNKLNFFISVAFVIVMLNGEAYSPYILTSLIVIYGAKSSDLGNFLSYKKKPQTGVS